MAELPEVETIKNDLRAHVLGRRFVGVAILDLALVRYPSPERFADELLGRQLLAAERRAKYLLLRLSGGAILVVQLMLTGQLLLLPPSTRVSKSTRLIIDLDSGAQLRLADTSRYAQVRLVAHEAELYERTPLGELGPEALDPNLSKEQFVAMLARRKRQIKALLLDQRFLAGLGNIYVDESLFASGIHPGRLANTLTPEEAGKLYDAFRSILARSIANRGTTTRSYKDIFGRSGRYQAHLQVFARTGEQCFRCGGQVVKSTVAGRDTYLCPNCQRLAPPEQAAEAGSWAPGSAIRR